MESRSEAVPLPMCGGCGRPIVGHVPSPGGEGTPCCSIECALAIAARDRDDGGSRDAGYTRPAYVVPVVGEQHEHEDVQGAAMRLLGAMREVADSELLTAEAEEWRRRFGELAARHRTAIGLLTDAERSLEAIRAFLTAENAR